MYEACLFAMDLERVYTVSARTCKEAVTRAWRACAQDRHGEDEDVTSWEPDDLRLATTNNELLTNNDPYSLSPLEDHMGGTCVIVDLGRMKVPLGFVRKIA